MKRIAIWLCICCILFSFCGCAAGDGTQCFSYTYLDAFTMLWVGVLLLFGMMVTHDYSLGKGVLTAVLTVVGILVIIFISLLLMNLSTDALVFFQNIYDEIVFRFR